jgi:hypothetical protein
MQLHVIIAEREEQARLEGQRAFEDGKTVDQCPHRSHTREADLWRRGFANAQFGAQMSKRP